MWLGAAAPSRKSAHSEENHLSYKEKCARRTFLGQHNSNIMIIRKHSYRVQVTVMKTEGNFIQLSSPSSVVASFNRPDWVDVPSSQCHQRSDHPEFHTKAAMNRRHWRGAKPVGTCLSSPLRTETRPSVCLTPAPPC